MFELNGRFYKKSREQTYWARYIKRTDKLTWCGNIPTYMLINRLQLAVPITRAALFAKFKELNMDKDDQDYLLWWIQTYHE